MFKMIKKGKAFCSPIKNFVCDTEDELENIKNDLEEIPFASVAYVTSTKKNYVFNGNKEWIFVKGVADYV